MKPARPSRAAALWRCARILLSRRPAAGPAPFRPRLEVLEGRALPSVTPYVVTDPADAAGSSADVTLRYAIEQAVAGGQTATITFARSLAGRTLTLAMTDPTSDGPTRFFITNEANVTIDASGAPGLTLDAAGDRMFDVDEAAALALKNLKLTGGHAAGGNNGGALFNNGQLTVLDCSLYGNSASNNGGAISNNGQLTVLGCSVHNNSASNNAGALFNEGTLTMAGSTIANNTCSNNGGGLMDILEGQATVTGCTFGGNSASNNGGGLVVGFGAQATLTNCTFGGNSSAHFGGGLAVFFDGQATVTSCTISGNAASPRGGGIADLEGSLVLNNSIVANSPRGGDVYNGGEVSGGYDLIGDGEVPGGLTNCLTGDPGLDPRGLRDNGGPTPTIALVAGSQAIDAGCNTRIPRGVTTDQRGNPRVMGGNVDIGAYEFSPAAATMTTLTSSGGTSAVGLPVTFTAAVAVPGTGAVVTGTVTFCIDGVAVATVPLVGGKAHFRTAALAFGCHKITARYNGIASGPVWYLPSVSAPLTLQTVRWRQS